MPGRLPRLSASEWTVASPVIALFRGDRAMIHSDGVQPWPPLHPLSDPEPCTYSSCKQPGKLSIYRADWAAGFPFRPKPPAW